MYQYRKLRGRIVEKYGSIRKFSNAIGISETATSNKLNGKTGLSQKDMEKWASLLDIDLSEFPEYYFK